MNITQNKFEDNIATKEGGAIYYNYNRPVISNNTFIKNQAVYGRDIASYPVKIVMNDNYVDYMSITSVGSGIKYTNDITLALVDYDNQVMVLDNQNLININPLNYSNSSILGTNHDQLFEGVETFSDLIFQGQPGISNVKFVVSSNAIDSNKIQSVFGVQISENHIDVSFRWCKPGEIYDTTNKCIK